MVMARTCASAVGCESAALEAEVAGAVRRVAVRAEVPALRALRGAGRRVELS